MIKSILLKLFCLVIGLCFFSITIYSQNFDTQLNLQDSTQNHIIILKSGKKFKGKILQIQNEKIFFETKKKKENITLTLSEIKAIKVQGHLPWNKKKYDRPFQYSQYLFYKNTGFSLQEGEKSYRTFMGASMLWDRGVTNGFSIGLGYSFPFLLHINLKFSTPNPQNSATSFKSNFSTIPLSFSDDELFFVFENSIAHSIGTPDRYFNISASNYFIKNNRDFVFNRDFIPKVYYSISLGGGIRMNENWQFMIENHVNFNQKFVDGNLLPSFGFNYATAKYNVGFGFHSPNRLGFNLYPIIETNEDVPVIFTPEVFSRLPFFTFSKIF
ncbi:MAG: hypothetical protein AB8F94_09785 [Saprospiraceae bacterium]